MTSDIDREHRHDAWIEQLLEADARDHAGDYIHDEGFTARVIAGLPAALEVTPRWRKPALVALWGVAAAGAAVALPELALDVGREAFRILAAHPVSLPQIGAGLMALAVATWSAAAYALKSD